MVLAQTPPFDWLGVSLRVAWRIARPEGRKRRDFWTLSEKVLFDLMEEVAALGMA
jgi:hypothetical protein